MLIENSFNWFKGKSSLIHWFSSYLIFVSNEASFRTLLVGWNVEADMRLVGLILLDLLLEQSRRMAWIEARPKCGGTRRLKSSRISCWTGDFWPINNCWCWSPVQRLRCLLRSGTVGFRNRPRWRKASAPPIVSSGRRPRIYRWWSIRLPRRNPSPPISSE